MPQACKALAITGQLTAEAQLRRLGHRVELRPRTELGEDRSDVRADRGVADMETLGHGPVIGTLRHESQDFLLPGRQAGEYLRLPGLLAGDLAVSGQRVGNRPGWNEVPAGGRRADRLDDLVAAR